MIIIGKFINGICLNPMEYLLDKPEEDGGIPMEFENIEKAKEFLLEQADDKKAMKDDLDNNIFHFVDAETYEVL